MNEQIRWEQSLIKKYSSSNHFKLLNQLRNEINKYPLNNKKNISSNISTDNKLDSKINLNVSKTQDLSFSNNTKITNEINNNKTTVSFNNSKNFSIYNNVSNDSKKDKIESKSLEDKTSNEDNSLSSFKDRLNQIDMK